MKLQSTVELYSTAAGGQTDSSSFIGRKYRVRDTKYGHDIGEYDFPEEAEHASLTRPYSKVVSQPDLSNTPAVRDIARKRLVKTNPDVDGASVKAGGPGSGRRPWKQLQPQFVSIAKKHGLQHNLANAKTKGFYDQGGTLSHTKGHIAVHSDGSWVHQGRNWSGRHGTLPKDYGRGSSPEDLDNYLSRK